MKKFLKSVGICLGLMILNQLIIGLISVIGAVFIKDSNKISEYIYILVFIGDLITLILVNIMYSIYDKKLLSKEIFKKIDFKDVMNITLFGIGLSVILLNLAGILTKIIPNYINTQNQLQSASNSLVQLIIMIILIPIYEEIIFRYVIFGYLKRNYSLTCAVIGQALIFGLAHLNIVQGIYTFVLGIALALMYIYSESLLGSIILHLIFNLLGILIIPKLVAINPIMAYMIIAFGIVCLVISILQIIKKYEKALYE
ncbi:CPBP family intramembrane glutamic endopeptidase [Paraclostridium sordellii]|uniref:CPBP family intramembrane glutamic endopeptidase n=1 Tax=Paraclostridium sordellii TaxID=1505 RepID=UPI0005E41033|nr:type II CAAX endopeptidase family protein [Paeniclostridium sordellii]CEP43546.1 CAAX amino terminal protease family protein [[Clostridium] sordellii] [Paeniclostridium sordellii]CEP50385.1 CAAX amino terminal protease family protein [[Clostridium] sordellii] [Paeniclostridium sordellii]